MQNQSCRRSIAGQVKIRYSVKCWIAYGRCIGGTRFPNVTSNECSRVHYRMWRGHVNTKNANASRRRERWARFRGRVWIRYGETSEVRTAGDGSGHGSSRDSSQILTAPHQPFSASSWSSTIDTVSPGNFRFRRMVFPALLRFPFQEHTGCMPTVRVPRLKNHRPRWEKILGSEIWKKKKKAPQCHHKQ